MTGQIRQEKTLFIVRNTSPGRRFPDHSSIKRLRRRKIIRPRPNPEPRIERPRARSGIDAPIARVNGQKQKPHAHFPKPRIIRLFGLIAHIFVGRNLLPVDFKNAGVPFSNHTARYHGFAPLKRLKCAPNTGIFSNPRPLRLYPFDACLMNPYGFWLFP